ncbi:MAG: MTAP family purine nucleoside phosphorylase [Fimbriimonadaceae bacterium]|nr:MTAP family purine nucleoside phosphorylase [Fimbriimonadaceae bacterium]
MIKADVALIGGTGIGSRLASLGGFPVHVPTEAGLLRTMILKQSWGSVALVQRHSVGHKTPPHLVNYKAIALGLKALGVKGCIASAAVGSLRRDWIPGTFVVCSDLLDLTARRQTLFDRKVVHTPLAKPMSLLTALLEASKEEGVVVQEEGVYLCADGPRYETPAEIQMMRSLGGDVVGMTASTEAILLAEAGIPYGCLAVVTNLGQGLSPVAPYHEEVAEMMEGEKGECAVRIMLRAAKAVAQREQAIG